MRRIAVDAMTGAKGRAGSARLHADELVGCTKTASCKASGSRSGIARRDGTSDTDEPLPSVSSFPLALATHPMASLTASTTIGQRHWGYANEISEIWTKLISTPGYSRAIVGDSFLGIDKLPEPVRGVRPLLASSSRPGRARRSADDRCSSRDGHARSRGGRCSGRQRRRRHCGPCLPLRHLVLERLVHPLHVVRQPRPHLRTTRGDSTSCCAPPGQILNHPVAVHGRGPLRNIDGRSGRHNSDRARHRLGL